MDGYKTSNKVLAFIPGLQQVTTNVAYGISNPSYDEKTGVLTIDAGFDASGSATTRSLVFSDGTLQASGYLVINASKNPALTGLGLNRVAAQFQNTTGQSIPSGTATAMVGNTVVFDTNGAFNPSTGVYTVPETGYYQVSGIIGFQAAAGVVGAEFGLYIITTQGDFRISSSIMETTATTSKAVSGSRTIRLDKGNTVTFSALQTTGGNRSLSTTATFNNFSISKISV